ncbi:hypothetical protein [Ensifer canadensis]
MDTTPGHLKKKVAHDLSGADLIESIRGRNSGITLARPSERPTFGGF